MYKEQVPHSSGILTLDSPSKSSGGGDYGVGSVWLYLEKEWWFLQVF